MPRLSLSEGKFGGLLLLAYEMGLAHGEEAVKLTPWSEDDSAVFVRDPVAREEQRRVFHAWVQAQLREVVRLNRAAAGERLLAENGYRGRLG
jgi:hypothetical protein